MKDIFRGKQRTSANRSAIVLQHVSVIFHCGFRNHFANIAVHEFIRFFPFHCGVLTICISIIVAGIHFFESNFVRSFTRLSDFDRIFVVLVCVCVFVVDVFFVCNYVPRKYRETRMCRNGIIANTNYHKYPIFSYC